MKTKSNMTDKEKKIKILSLDNKDLFKIGLYETDSTVLVGYDVSYLDQERVSGIIFLLVKKINELVKKVNRLEKSLSIQSKGKMK